MTLPSHFGRPLRLSRGLAMVAALPFCAVSAWAQAPNFKEWPRNPGLPDVRRVSMPPLRVTDIAVAGTTTWVSTRGSGVFGVGPGGVIHHLDLGSPLPSALVWQVQPVDGKLLIGTDRGTLRVDPERLTFEAIDPAAASSASVPGKAVDVLRLSPRDNLPLLQLRASHGTDESAGSLGQWRIKGGELLVDTSLPLRLAITASSLEPGARCLDLGGLALERDERVLWFSSECAQAPLPRRIEGRGKAPRDAIGVAAIARDPTSQRPVLAVVTQRGQDQATRSHVLFELSEGGELSSHCSDTAFRNEVTGMVNLRHREMIVALYGAGVVAVDCRGVRPLLTDPGPVRWATALAVDDRAPNRLLVGTDDGLYALEGDPGTEDPAAPQEGKWKAVRLLGCDEGKTVAADALPTDLSQDGRRVLVVAPKLGAIELDRGAIPWQVVRTLQPGGALPAGSYGAAFYTSDKDVAVLVHSHGIFRTSGSDAGWLDPGGVATRPHVLNAAAQDDAGIWVAVGATPAGASGGLRWYPRDGKPPPPIRLPGALTEPSGTLLTWPGGIVWAGSRAGVLRADADGHVGLLSTNRVQALFRHRDNPALVAAVGATVERWTGTRFEPVLFTVPADALLKHGQLGHPIDVVLDSKRRWAILYSSGLLVLLDAEARFEAVLGSADGIPATARKLLLLPAADELVIGSGGEGIFVLKR